MYANTFFRPQVRCRFVVAATMVSVLMLCLQDVRGVPTPVSIPSLRADICSLKARRTTLPGGQGRDRRQTGTDLFSRWPHGVIPYSLDPSLAKGGRQLRKSILRAMLLWSRRTPVLFVPHTTQDDFVRIVWGRRCCSMEGRQGGGQTIQIGRRCNSRASLLHHLGHVAGLAIHGPQLERRSKSNNRIPTVDEFHRLVQQQANPSQSLMLLKYHELPSKAARRQGKVKYQPGQFDIIRLKLLYPRSYCGGHFVAPLVLQNTTGRADREMTDRVTSPDFPDWYWSDADCTWHIEGQANQLVIMQRRYMSLELSTDCHYDYVEIADVSTGNVTRYCGRDFPQTLVSSSRFGFTIRFHSDSAQQANGFHLKYHAVVDGCQTNICSHGCAQQVNSSVCTCPVGMRLWRDGVTCISSGGRCSTPQGTCQHGCELDADGFAICTCMAGFLLDNNNLTCSRCVYNITVGDQPGWVHSPNFPGLYPRSTECEWHLKSTDPHKLIVLRLEQFHMQPEDGGVCLHDYLDIYTRPDSFRPAIRACDHVSQKIRVRSETTYAKLVLHSDGSEEYTGFRVKYFAEGPPADSGRSELGQMTT